MLAGGEEYFAPPAEIDIETLTRFAALSAKLRRFEKAGKKSIQDLVDECEAVGTSLEAKQIVAGVVMRCIRSSTGARQLAYWFLLDKLAKDFPHTFGYQFGLHVEETACDVMPWEDPALEPKLQSLVEHWDSLFPADVVHRIYLAKKERKWLAAHPKEAEEMRKAEEAKWAQVERENVELDGLDTYEQPCLAYLQGRCTWGAGCTMLHPEGLEGTLPPETRLGDWCCPGCGAINRHFRRRCFSCPREKPQFRRDGQIRTKDEIALSQPDPEAMGALRQSFGYNPCDEAEAVEFWNRKFAVESVASYIEARRVAYVNQILPALRQSRVGRADNAAARGNEVKKQHRAEAAPAPAAVQVRLPTVPSDLAPADLVFHLCRVIVERGAMDPQFVGHLFLLAQTMPKAVKEARFSASRSPEDSMLLVECFKRVFASWTTWHAALASGQAAVVHPAAPFFADVRKYASLLPLTDAHRRDVLNMCAAVSQS